MPISSIDYLRLIVTSDCNLKCYFCYEEGISEKCSVTMSLNDAINYCRIFSKIGVRKIRLTGGEPLAWPHLENFLFELSSLKIFDRIAITTNGVFLAERAEKLHSLGVTDISISLHYSTDSKFFKYTRSNNRDLVLKAVEAVGKLDFKRKVINMVYTITSNFEDFLVNLEIARKNNLVLRVIDVVIKDKAYKSLNEIESWVLQKSTDSKYLKRNITQYNLRSGGTVEIDRNPCNQAKQGDRDACLACAKEYPARITPNGKLKPCLLRNENLLTINEIISDSEKSVSSHINKSLTVRGPKEKKWQFNFEELFEG